MPCRVVMMNSLQSNHYSFLVFLDNIPHFQVFSGVCIISGMLPATFAQKVVCSTFPQHICYVQHM